MHPDAFALHQWTEHQWPATVSLSNAENVDRVLVEALVDLIELQSRVDDVIVVEQEDQLSLCRIDGGIATDAHADIVFGKVDDSAVLRGDWMELREAATIQTIIYHDNVGTFKMLKPRYDQPIAGPRTMYCLNAKRNVFEELHGSPELS